MSTELSRRAKARVLLGALLLRRVPFWQRTRARSGARYVVLACYVYVASLLGLVAAQNWLVFPGVFIRGSCEPPDYLRVRKLTLTSADGNGIQVWFSAPEGWEPHRGAILISHGNGDTLCSMSGTVSRWRQEVGRAVVVFDYPGYGQSTGAPSEAGCYAAGEAALRWLTNDQRVPVSEIILYGESLGGATAVELASRNAVRLLVLHAAFTSFPDVAQNHLPWYPTRYLVHIQMDNEAKIRRVRCPVLIAHGTADRTVPFDEGDRLFAAALSQKDSFAWREKGTYRPTKRTFSARSANFFRRQPALCRIRCKPVSNPFGFERACANAAAPNSLTLLDKRAIVTARSPCVSSGD